jgi:hypothetical protein
MTCGLVAVLMLHLWCAKRKDYAVHNETTFVRAAEGESIPLTKVYPWVVLLHLTAVCSTKHAP